MAGKEEMVQIRFVKAECHRQPLEPDCPVRNESEFEVRRDGSDQFKLSQLPDHPTARGAGEFIAACPICESHRHVKIVEE